MEIALLANDSKKELMVQFCIAYCGVLAKHRVCATKATGSMISEATGLRIEQLLPGGQGGISQLTSRISFNEIDVLLLIASLRLTPVVRPTMRFIEELLFFFQSPLNVTETVTVLSSLMFDSLQEFTREW